MTQEDLDDIGIWLSRANHAMSRAFTQAVSKHGFTFRQAQVVTWIMLDGPMSQRDLADRMLMEPPNLVSVLDKMEAEGLVARSPCPSDGRKNLVTLLPAAEGPWMTIAEAGLGVRNRMLTGMSDEQLEQAKAVLKQMAANLADDG